MDQVEEDEVRCSKRAILTGMSRPKCPPPIPHFQAVSGASTPRTESSTAADEILSGTLMGLSGFGAKGGSSGGMELNALLEITNKMVRRNLCWEMGQELDSEMAP